MSLVPSSSFLRGRNCILGSAAVVALAAAGAIGEGAFSAPQPAHAANVSAPISQSPMTETLPSFSPLIAHVKPAVVSVKVKIVHNGSSTESAFGNLPPEIQQFLKRFGEQNGAPANPRSIIMGEGSGFFISSDGYIVTNYHVVQDSKSVTVTMDNGKVLDAKVIGTDPKTDLALLKVHQQGDYPYVTLAKQTPKIGDWVVAIGNPYGLGGTVTAGIVSAEGRDIGDGPYDRFLQIDAPINKGNSGGPAFNEQGEVVGVNTAIYSPSGGSVGIGFAIPSTTVTRVVDALEHGGIVARGYLGVQIQPVGPEIAEALGLNKAEGAIVDKAMEGTPAAEAGLKAGDIITKLNGRDVKDAGDLTREIGEMKPGEKVQLSYLREGAEKTADVTLAPQKNEKVASADFNSAGQANGFGLELAPAQSVEGSNQKGVSIVGVDPAGEAAQQGLSSGDVILDVAGKAVSSPRDVTSGIDAAKQEGKKAVLMRIQTADGTDRFIALPFPKA